MKKTFALIGSFLIGLGFASASAATITETHTFSSLNLDIPDGDPSGLADVRSFLTDIATILEVEVSLEIAATPDASPLAFNGDLYVYLQHSTGLSILLNRAGKTATSSFGYSDNGLDITFDDEAVDGDIHVYRDVTTPASGQSLTGTWVPDARATDPDLVLDTDARTSFLSVFDGLDPAGNWTLLVADLSTGEEHQLKDWSLTITGEQVPEPSATALLAATVLLYAQRRRRAPRS